MGGSGGDYAHLADLQHDFKVLPATVVGRTLNIDGDFLPYQFAFPEDLPFAVLRENLFNSIENRKIAAGAEFVKVHLTHPLSDKAKRFDIAVSQTYQGNRSGKSHPKHWHALNTMLHEKEATDHRFVVWQDREADDGLAQAAWQAERNNESHLNVTCSNDKDLRQAPGLYLDWNTNNLMEHLHEHMYADYVQSPEAFVLPSTIKQGALFHGVWFLLWQMLQGDSTDNIPGVGAIAGTWLLANRPDQCSARAVLGKEQPKDKPCGPALAASLLGALPSNRPSAGYALVKAIYEAHYGIRWVDYFKEQWQLLALYYSDVDDRLTLARAVRDGVLDGK